MREPTSVTLRGAPFGRAPTYARVVGGHVRTARLATELADASSALDIGRLCALATFTEPGFPHASIFRNVARVPSGGSLTFDRAGSVTAARGERYVASVSLSPIDAADELWRRTIASVERAVRGAHRVAVLTGGGVDSGALLAAAVAIARGANDMEVTAVTLDFAGAGDDRPYLRALADSLGIVALRVKPGETGPDVRALLESDTLPIWTPSASADLALLRRAAECGADVVLTGLGGDDVLDGMPTLLADDLAHGDLGAVVQAARLAVPWQSSAIERVSSFILRPLLGPLRPRTMQRARRRRIHRSQWPWAGPAALDFIDDECERWSRAKLDTPSDRFGLFASGVFLADVIELAAEFAHRAGIRVVHPYLDESLVELACGLPPRLFFQGNRLRGLFRLGARGTLIDAVRLRKDKASFDVARREALEAAGGVDAFEDLATMTASAACGLVDADRFQRHFRRFPAASLANDEAWTWMWPWLAIEGFLRAYARKRGAC